MSSCHEPMSFREMSLKVLMIFEAGGTILGPEIRALCESEKQLGVRPSVLRVVIQNVARRTQAAAPDIAVNSLFEDVFYFDDDWLKLQLGVVSSKVMRAGQSCVLCGQREKECVRFFPGEWGGVCGFCVMLCIDQVMRPGHDAEALSLDAPALDHVDGLLDGPEVQGSPDEVDP